MARSDRRAARVVQHGAYGVMDVESGKPVTEGTLFRLASSSKPVTAVAVLMFESLGMNDTFLNVPEKDFTPTYFSGAGGLVSTAGDYFRFAQMLCNGGELDGKRILSPWTVDLMMRNNVGDLFLRQIGRSPKGMGFGLGGEVGLNNAEARTARVTGGTGRLGRTGG